MFNSDQNLLKIAALYRTECPHHLDHLLPLCELLSATFITSDEAQEGLAREFYPPTSIKYIDRTRLTTDYLRQRYDLVIHSFPWPKKMINFSFNSSEKDRKILRSLFTPHGNSDKGYHIRGWEHFAHEDLSLLYGKQMLDAIQKQNISISNYILTGNLRYHYYCKYKSHFDRIIKNRLEGHLDPSKKTIFYAPSWEDPEKSGSLRLAYQVLFDTLPNKYNLIVKLHPLQAETTPAELIYILSKYEGVKNLHFVENCPLVFPFLNSADLYLGDFSSIGYDFLLFNKPMVFLNLLKRSKEDPMTYLHQCGEVVTDIATIEKAIDKAFKQDHYKTLRQEVCDYAFAKVSPEEVRNRLYTLYYNESVETL